MPDLEISGPGVDTWIAERLTSWKIKELTDIQKLALQAGVAKGESLIVCAPTSSGKTLVGEIAVLAALRKGMRAIYLVSHKALADQKYADFVLRFGEEAEAPLASVGLSTGDREEGDVDAQLVVATYEKALGLVLTGQLKPNSSLIVADELQILGESGRGPEIESLCALFRKNGCGQFLALTATVENPEDLAGWLNCKVVRSSIRDVPLHQEIWYGTRRYRMTFGQSEGQELGSKPLQAGLINIVRELIEDGRGPVLVFTESRKEAADYAEQFSQTRPRVVDGIAIAQQLDLFSEPTESSERLRANAERKVVFHNADLSPQERQVLEGGFAESRFDVCFATSTLAAGVNFPFRTVVFPKLTFQWGDRAGTQLPRSEYRNMSGRAGRLGMHPDGCAVLLPSNNVELAHANRLVQPDNEKLESQLVKLSLRKSILALVASKIASNFEQLMEFFRNTLYWHQILERNPGKLETLEAESIQAIRWLVENRLLEEREETLLITPLGYGAAISGLLPSTAVQFAEMLRRMTQQLSTSFEQWVPGLIYAACASDEFRGSTPSRYFPFPPVTQDSMTYWSARSVPVHLNRSDFQLAQCAHSVVLFAEGMAERKIAFATRVSAGGVHRIALDVAWILEGLHKISCVPDIGCPQTVSNQIGMLARRVRWGAPVEALDVMRVAERHRVPGFGRQRAMALIAQGIATVHDVVGTALDRLSLLLRNDVRAKALHDAASSTIGFGADRYSATHIRVAKELGIAELVEACNTKIGVEYEIAIANLLKVETGWIVTVLDDGARQNVPDLMLELAGRGVLIECKTCTKIPFIKKEDAWAVLQKAADFDPRLRRVTLGKPNFDETCKKKAAASTDITLAPHSIFMEAILRVHKGSLSSVDFLTWLSQPGISDISRLGGVPTFVE